MSAVENATAGYMTTGEALALAESWAKRGIPVFPIAISWDDVKGKTNKRPLTAHGFHDAATEQRAVRLMFNTATPRPGEALGVGLHPGPAGLLFVDVDGLDAVERYEERDLPATFTVTTCSGARHYVYRKPQPGQVGTSCDWPEVDVIRADDGFVVAPGTVTPWGEWVSHDDFAADAIDAPPELWAVCDRKSHNAATAGTSGVATVGLDAVLARLRSVDRHQDADALEVLCKRYGGHSPFVKGDGEVFVTRPGKRAGTSASVGYVAPGVVKMFTGHDETGGLAWPPFTEGGRYTLVADGTTLVAEGDALQVTRSPETAHPEQIGRHVALTAASSFKLRRVRWLWEERIALGTLSLLAGPEGLGKSTVVYWMTARITRGELPGEMYGTPKAVLVCATEDSWEHTIVPRLLAHGADLDRVFRIEVHVDDLTVGLSLPHDIVATEQAARDVDAALLVLDPLMSRLNAKLDAHRDGEVRRALEPLAATADRARLGVLGIIHHNKSGSTNPLDLVMASKAFTAVARSVHTTIRDSDDDTGNRRLFGTPKNNLGRGDLPTLSYTVESFTYPTDDGAGSVGRIVWGDDVDGSIADHLRRGDESPEHRTAVADASDWLDNYMRAHGPTVLSSDVKAAAKADGHARPTLDRARKNLRIDVDSTTTFPRRTFWVTPVALSSHGRPRGDTLETTVLSETTNPRSGPVVSVVSVVLDGGGPETTGTTAGITAPPICPLCSADGYDRASGACSTPGCAGF